VSAAWVGVQRILCHDKWDDANGELKHIWLTQPCYYQMQFTFTGDNYIV